MLTIDERLTHASPEWCWKMAADVENWPNILPHYRWVRFERKDGFALGVVEMAANRDFGPLPYPTWWKSEMWHDPDERTIYYKHVGGVTTGMSVSWEVRPQPDGRTLIRIVHEWSGPRWPLISRFAADHVIGPHFVSFIAQRTLAGVAIAAESHTAEGQSGP